MRRDRWVVSEIAVDHSGQVTDTVDGPPVRSVEKLVTARVIDKRIEAAAESEAPVRSTEKAAAEQAVVDPLPITVSMAPNITVGSGSGSILHVRETETTMKSESAADVHSHIHAMVMASFTRIAKSVELDEFAKMLLILIVCVAAIVALFFLDIYFVFPSYGPRKLDVNRESAKQETQEERPMSYVLSAIGMDSSMVPEISAAKDKAKAKMSKGIEVLKDLKDKNAPAGKLTVSGQTVGEMMSGWKSEIGQSDMMQQVSSSASSAMTSAVTSATTRADTAMTAVQSAQNAQEAVSAVRSVAFKGLEKDEPSPAPESSFGAFWRTMGGAGTESADAAKAAKGAKCDAGPTKAPAVEGAPKRRPSAGAGQGDAGPAVADRSNKPDSPSDSVDDGSDDDIGGAAEPFAEVSSASVQALLRASRQGSDELGEKDAQGGRRRTWYAEEET